MAAGKFVHLHNHSEYSLLDGMIRITDGDGHPSQFLRSAAAKNVPAMAITDHGNMYGAMEFYFTALEAGIRPILGCEVYLAPGSRKEKNPQKENGHLTLLVRDTEGYRNLMKIVSDAYLSGFYYSPRTDLETLEKHQKGLVALSGCLKSSLAKLCLAGDIKKAAGLADRFAGIFGKDNFYIELMDHGLEDEKTVLTNLRKVAGKTGLEVVATNDCHYPFPGDYEAHDAHICIGRRSLLSEENRFKMNTDQLYFKSEEEMINLFSHTPRAVANTLEIAEKCNLKIDAGKFHLPRFDCPPGFKNEHEYLRKLCFDGLRSKGAAGSKEYVRRMEEELGIIRKMGFSSYFLIVMDFIKHARNNGYMVGPGRGSGAGSLVAFSLDITRVDPLKNGLLFERFLNPDRNTMPDLDIDFAVEGRNKVIEYVRRKYGEDNVANIITYGTIKAKSAVKDVGRVMGMEPAYVNEITKKFLGNASLYSVMNEVPEIAEKIKTDFEFRKLFEIARKIEGLRRHTGVHAAGVVITNNPVVEHAPLSNQNRANITTTQYDGNMLTRLGLLKVDFLGLRTLDVIQGASKLIRRENESFDIDEIPMDDAKTFKLLCKGETTGVFQLESDGMKELIKAIMPSKYSDISALVALYRPGPIKSGMLDEFVARKNGKKKINYEHPILESVLKDTYGTIVYQEQVMAIAKEMAGFSPGDADYLRKAMSKKDTETMERFKEVFITGSVRNRIPASVAEKIFSNIIQFAGYGFNKSHSAAYALIAYQTAYLKANYPVEYMASLLTSEIGKNAVDVEDKENKIVTYAEDAGEMGIEILPPDINSSFADFSIQTGTSGPALRFALSAVKNVGEGVVGEIVAEREKNGKYAGVADFAERLSGVTRLNKSVLESLAKSGAFDCFSGGKSKEKFRADVLANLDGYMEKCRRKKENPAQQILFSCDSINSLIDSEEKSSAKPLAEHEILSFEKEVLGMYVSGHPLTRFRRRMAMITKFRIKSLKSGGFPAKSRVKVAGMIVSVKKIKTRKGFDMLKFEIEDLTDSISVCLFPRKHGRYSSLVKANRMVVVDGLLNESSFNGRTDFEIYADEIVKLEDAFEKWGKSIALLFHDGFLLDEERLSRLKEVFGRHKGNRETYIRARTRENREYLVELENRVRINRDLIEDIEKVLGEKTWQVESGY